VRGLALQRAFSPVSPTRAMDEESKNSKFLHATYEMVNDPNTDAIISWLPDSTDGGFVVHDPYELARSLLSRYYKVWNCFLFLLGSVVFLNSH